MRMFLKAYSEIENHPVQCYSPDLVIDEQVKKDDQLNMILNYCGLAVISYRSVVTYESNLFGSPYRGYLLLFRYTILDGPLSAPVLPTFGVMLDFYTSKHLVSRPLRLFIFSY